MFGLFALPEPPRAARSPDARVFRLDQLRTALRDGRIGVLFVLSYLFLFAFSGFESMFTRFGLLRFPEIFHLPAGVEQITLKQVMEAAPVAGRYMAGIGIVSAIIQGGLIRRLVPRFGETRLAIAGPLFLAGSFVVVGLASSWWVVLAGCALMPFGIGLNNPAVFGLISRAAPQDEQGAYLGLNQSVSSFARMTGPVAAGALFQAYGPSRPFLVGAAVLFGSALVATYYRARWGSTFVNAPAPDAPEAAPNAT
jgi:DHA1 family tetracycline resistance protein-like MFS transporter